jgi:LuxR family maltose regulon positive regulatory protein
LFLPLLSFKFNIPLIGAQLVRRPCLLRMLDVNLEKNASLTLVCEPAGYGKTTVVSEWLQAPQELRPAGLGSEQVGTTIERAK